MRSRCMIMRPRDCLSILYDVVDNNMHDCSVLHLFRLLRAVFLKTSFVGGNVGAEDQ